MINGYIYDTSNRKIACKIPCVIECTDVTIVGKECKAVIGTGKYIISDQEYNEGQILPDDVVDMRDVVMKI